MLQQVTKKHVIDSFFTTVYSDYPYAEELFRIVVVRHTDPMTRELIYLQKYFGTFYNYYNISYSDMLNRSTCVDHYHGDFIREYSEWWNTHSKKMTDSEILHETSPNTDMVKYKRNLWYLLDVRCNGNVIKSFYPFDQLCVSHILKYHGNDQMLDIYVYIVYGFFQSCNGNDQRIHIMALHLQKILEMDPMVRVLAESKNICHPNFIKGIIFRILNVVRCLIVKNYSVSHEEFGVKRNLDTYLCNFFEEGLDQSLVNYNWFRETIRIIRGFTSEYFERLYNQFFYRTNSENLNMGCFADFLLLCFRNNLDHILIEIISRNMDFVCKMKRYRNPRISAILFKILKKFFSANSKRDASWNLCRQLLYKFHNNFMVNLSRDLSLSRAQFLTILVSSKLYTDSECLICLEPFIMNEFLYNCRVCIKSRIHRSCGDKLKKHNPQTGLFCVLCRQFGMAICSPIISFNM
jgi:hypothetical protein